MTRIYRDAQQLAGREVRLAGRADAGGVLAARR
jgi:hypothetical protein